MRKRNRHGDPHAPADTRWGKRGIALFLSAAMCLTMLPGVAFAEENTAATTDEYGFDLSTPSGFNANDGVHPLGQGSNIKGNLNPTKEISIMESRGDNYSSRVYDFDETSILKGSSGGIFSSTDHYAGLDGTKFSTASAMSNTTIQTEHSPYRYVSAVAFDRDGSGRDSIVAYWGATRGSGDSDYRMQLNVFKENSGSFSSGSAKYTGSDANDAYSWMSKLNGYNAEGYTAITAGDFDGNGKESLVFYDPQKGDLKLKSSDGYYSGATDVLDIGNDSTLKNYFGKSLNEIQKQGGDDLQRVADNTAMVQLEAADLDGRADNKDELIVTISLGNLYGEKDINERGSVVMVLSKQGSSWTTIWSYQFSHVYASNQPTNKYDTGWHLRAAASRAEDIDNDGAMEIVTAGVGSDDNGNDDNFHDAGYFVVVTEYDGNGYKVDTTEQTSGNTSISCQNGIYVKQDGDNNTNWVGEKGPNLQYMNPCSLGIVRFDGRGTVPYIVIRGQIFKYKDGTLEGAETRTGQTDGVDLVLKDRTIILQPIVGNFDGNAAGREQILFVLSSGDNSAVNIGGYYYKPSDYDSSKGTGKYQSTGFGASAMNDGNKGTNLGLRSCRWGLYGWSAAEVALAAPDIDNDGIIAEFQSKDYAYNDPQVLAVMEAPPYFEDIEYNNAGETAISFSKGSGSSSSSSTANRIGTYVSFEQDFSLGGIVDLGGVEFETSMEAEWNNSIEKEKTFTMTNSFSTEQAESAVVLICIPVTIYHYKTTSADGSRNTMDITVADTPVYKTIPLSEYNAAAAQRGDPEIGSDIIASTAGQPTTYRTTATGLKEAVTTQGGTNGGWFDSAAGESSKSQSVAFEQSEGHTKEFTFNIDAKGGGGAGGFKFGLSGGSSAGSSASTISTEGIERSGTVHDLPSGTTGYSFQWKFVGWETTLTTGGLSYKVPVLSYLVQNVQQPPSKPQNLEATEVGTNSVKLEWESGFSTAAQYEVYRYMPNNTSGTQYAILGTVSGVAADADGKYTLTDTRVMPSTQYQYVLKSVGTDGKSTDYTEPLAVTTLSDGAMPQITEQPQSLSVRPGTDATFSIKAIPSAGNNTNGVTYRWQSRTDGGRWTDLNRSSAALTIEKVTTGMSGTQYRCIVSQTDLTTQLSAVVYSDTATLTVGKAGSTTTLDTSGSGGNATHETTGTEQKTVAAQYKIDGKTYQQYANAYNGIYKLDADVYGTYVSNDGEYQYFLMDGLSLNGTPDANGVFTGSGTPEKLNPTEDRVTLNGTMYKIGAGGFQRTQETDGDYAVYTATAVAGEQGQQDTLTLYCKDGTYYRKDNNSLVQMAEVDTISDTDTNKYRKDSLTEVYKTDASGYTILTYGSETIYELNGTYYSKNDSTYSSLSVETGLYESAGQLFKPGAVATTKITVTGSKEQVAGQKVTLTATVGTADSTAATNGTVTFEITNTTTGNVTRYTVNKTSGQRTVTYDWTPSEAGVYSIVAIYSGNSQTATSRSSSFIYYAQAEEELYEIEVSDCIYGNPVSPSLKKVTISDSTGSASAEDGKAISYAAYKDGSSAAESWTSGNTLAPGSYRITATENDKVIASKYITVAKKPITVTAPNQKNGLITFTDKDGKSGFVAGDDYTTLFKTEGMPGDKTAAGVYNVSVVYNEDTSNFTAKQAEFLSKYAPVLRNSMVLVQADTYTVTYSHGNNGELFGYQGGNSVAFKSGASIAAGSQVLFSAKPAENYQVSKWTVKSGEQELVEGTDYTLSNGKTTLTIAALHKNLDVRVEFSNQFYTVSAQGDTNGSVTATVGGLVTSNYVLSGTEVTFTAAPKDGYVVKQWTVTRGNSTETQKNADGSDFSGKELKLTITANTTVSVTFEESAQYEVHYSAVKQTDTNTIVPLTFETTGLTDGKGEKGSTVTLTAKLSSAMGIVGWQYKTEADGAWTTTNVSGLSYTIQNLQSDIWVRALVNDSAAPTEVTFGIVDENDDTVPNGGTLTAKYAANDAPITSGTGCTTYSTITFTYEEPVAYEVVKWTVNGTKVEANRNGKTFTYTIDSLTAKTTVNMVVRPKPIVTVEQPTNGSIAVTYQLNDMPVEPEDANGVKYVYNGTVAAVTATPSENYIVTSIKAAWNGGSTNATNDKWANDEQTLTNITIGANTTFSAEFTEKPKVYITDITDNSGTVTVKGTVNGTAGSEVTDGQHVDFGTTLAVTATPKPGYVVDTITGTDVQQNRTNGAKDATITGVNADTTITATFTEKPKVTIADAADIRNGSVEVKGIVDGEEKPVANNNYVDFNTTLTVTATPDDGYVVEKINGTNVNTGKANGNVTIDGVDVGTEITATFIAKPVVTIKTAENGTVTVKGTVNGTANSTVANGQYVDFGKDLIVTLTPDMGYEVGNMEGADLKYTDSTGETTDEKSYTIENVQENQTITPVWAAIPTAEVNWSVIDKTPGADGGTDGTLTASVTRKGMDSYKVTSSDTGTLTVYRDSVVTFTAVPDDGYKIGVWQLNGAKQDSQPEITITDTATQTVQVQFDPRGNKVTYGFKADSAASSKHNAQLSAAFTPNGSTDASEFVTGTTPNTDGSITFTVSGLDDGYEVEGWYVDGIKQTGETGMTFTHGVTHDVGMDVQVKIVRKSYTVTFSGTNGTVTAAAGDAQLASGNSVVGDTSVTFTAKPTSSVGYSFAGWTVNDEASAETAETLTLDITEDTTVSAAYALNTASYAVNYGVVSDGHGTLTAKNGETAFASGEEQPAGSTIVFTAAPESGYQVKGWYADAAGNTEISGTASEQNSYAIGNLLEAADVYAAFEKIPTYDITVSATGRGQVTAAVNGTETAIENGTLTVNRHDNVVLTAVPDANQYLTGWTLDGDNKGNGSMTLTLNDVTEEHTAAADFEASQLVSLKTVCGENGTLTAEAGYGDNLSAIDASSTTGIQVEKGKKVVLKVTPDNNYMVEKWTVNGEVQDNLSNTLTIENLSENTTVEVAFETPLTLYSIPQSGDGYTVSDVKKIPGDYGLTNEIRARGTVTFTVAPENGKYLTELKVNGTDCLTEVLNAGDENKLTVQNNHDGSYTVTVANVTADIELSVTSMQFRTKKTELTLPTELQEKFADTDALKTKLRTQVNRSNASVPAANIQYYDIKLQYTTDGGTTWIDATREHFPANGITVEIPYSELMSGLDNSYTYTVIHMFTTDMKGHAVGTTESITPVKGANDISFTVDSLSPFAIGWYKAAANAGGGGGGGGAVVATTYVLTFEANGGSAIEKVTKDSGTTVELASYKPTRTGYTFDGWFSDKELTKPVTSVKLTADTTVYAKWTQNSEIKNPFVDVKNGDYFYDAVLWAVEQKITSGTSATTFSPAVSCTRAQMVTFLWRAAGSPKVENVSNPFTDVKPGSYYYDAVLWAVKNGVTSGTSTTTFSPDNTVTRGQTVTFLYRNAGSPDVETADSFTDVAATSYYAQAVAWAVKNGITTGVGNGKFDPDADCTRAQIVTFLYRNNLVK